MPLLVIGCRWYFPGGRPPPTAEAAGYAAGYAALAETVDAGRTIESHRLDARRIELSERRVKEWTAWERYTLWLRSVSFPVNNVTHVTVLASFCRSAVRSSCRGWIGVGQLTTAALIAQMCRPGRHHPALVRRAPGGAGVPGPTVGCGTSSRRR